MKKCFYFPTWEEQKEAIISLDEDVLTVVKEGTVFYNIYDINNIVLYQSTSSDPILAKLCELTGAKMYGDYIVFDIQDEENCSIYRRIYDNQVKRNFVVDKLIPFCMFLSKQFNDIFDKNKIIFSFIKYFECKIYINNIEYEGREYYASHEKSKEFLEIIKKNLLDDNLLKTLFFSTNSNRIEFNYNNFYTKFNDIKITEKTQIFDILKSYNHFQLRNLLQEQSFKEEKSPRLKENLLIELQKLFYNLICDYKEYNFRYIELLEEYSKFFRKEKNKWEEYKMILEI